MKIRLVAAVVGLAISYVGGDSGGKQDLGLAYVLVPMIVGPQPGRDHAGRTPCGLDVRGPHAVYDLPAIDTDDPERREALLQAIANGSVGIMAAYQSAW